MIIYDQTSIAFSRRCESLLVDILNSLMIASTKKYFRLNSKFWPVKVVVFEGKELGHFDFRYSQIALNRSLIFSAKDSVLKDILKHELAHYLTFIWHGAHVSPHGSEFKAICLKYGFSPEISAATMDLSAANESKEGDLESEAILEKVKKLLQLAQSSNVHESELATLKANAILLKHNLNLSQLSGAEEKIYLERVLERKKRDSKSTAIYYMLTHFFVRCVFSSGNGVSSLEISGTLTNVKLAVYMANFLDKELDRLWLESKKAHKLQGVRAKNSFFLGVSKGFDTKMEQSKKSYSATEKQSLIVIGENMLRKTSVIYRSLSSCRSTALSDGKAREIGQKEGQQLNLRQGVEGGAKNLYLSMNSF